MITATVQNKCTVTGIRKPFLGPNFDKETIQTDVSASLRLSQSPNRRASRGALWGQKQK